MFQTDSLEFAVRQVLAQVGPCSLEELNERLPYYSWNHVFFAIQRLKRNSIVVLQASCSSNYDTSLVIELSGQTVTLSEGSKERHDSSINEQSISLPEDFSQRSRCPDETRYG